MTSSSIILPGEGDAVVTETVEGGDHDTEKVQGCILWGYDPDGNPVPLRLTAAGSLVTNPVITKAPMELGGGYWFYDVRYRDADNTIPAVRGDVFDLTAVPHQGSTVALLILPPPPDEARLGTYTFHPDATDPTDFATLVVPTFDGGYTTNWVGPALTTGVADGDRIEVWSDGDDTFSAMNVTALTGPTAPFMLPSGLKVPDNGLLHGYPDLRAQPGRLEGVLDRWRFVCGVGIAPFDPSPFVGAGNGPVTGLDFGTAVAGGDIAVLGIADGSDSSVSWMFHVEDDLSLTPYVDPDVFNPPGNGGRVVLNAAGDSEDGHLWMWVGNDVTDLSRGGNTLSPADPTGRWLSYPAGTPI